MLFFYIEIHFIVIFLWDTMLHVLNWLAATQQRKSITLLTHWITFTSECRKPSNMITVQMWSIQQQVTFTAQIGDTTFRSVWSPHAQKHQKISKSQQQRKYENRTGLFLCLREVLQKTLQIYGIVLSGFSIACLLLLKASGHQIKLNSKQHIWPCSSVLRNYNGRHQGRTGAKKQPWTFWHRAAHQTRYRTHHKWVGYSWHYNLSFLVYMANSKLFFIFFFYEGPFSLG